MDDPPITPPSGAAAELSAETFRQLVAAVRLGHQGARDRLLAIYRPQLRAMIAVELQTQNETVADPSDLVQQSLMEAHRDLDQFHGTRPDEFLRWLKTIVHHDLADNRRHARRQKRDISAEVSLERLLGDQSGPGEFLAADESSPSRRLQRGETQSRLAAAIDQLPEDQARVVQLRHLQGMSLEEICRVTGKTQPAVAGLLTRAARRLRTLLKRDEG